MSPEQALQAITQALDSNSFTAPKSIHVQLQQCLEVIKQALQPKSVETKKE